MSLLFQRHATGREAIYLGLVFGLMGVVELIFVSDRYPYDTYTLIVTFAAFNSGPHVGLITAAVMSLGGGVFVTPSALARTILSIFASVLVGVLFRRAAGPRLGSLQARVLWAFAAIATAEIGAITLRLLLERPSATFSLSLAVLRIAANGFGVLLLQLILNDAQIRADADRYRAEAERSRTLMAESHLVALRARIHPHFLFNTLTSIAALCRIAPDRAETTIIRLGQIMRRALEADAGTALPLGDEIAHARDYAEIEQLRLGSRLRVAWEVDTRCMNVPLPPFSVLTLVENAVTHGVAPKMEPGTVTVVARRYPGHVLVAVVDDGVGMSPLIRGKAGCPAEDRPHGLYLLTQQLIQLHGRTARVRLYSFPDRGTCAVFIVPDGGAATVPPSAVTRDCRSKPGKQDKTEGHRTKSSAGGCV